MTITQKLLLFCECCFAMSCFIKKWFPQKPFLTKHDMQKQHPEKSNILDVKLSGANGNCLFTRHIIEKLYIKTVFKIKGII